MASVTVMFGGKEEKSYPLDGGVRLVVGREPKCEIQIDNLGISREHCAFCQRGTAYVVEDLNSSNGTYVNGKKITEHYLNNDDEIIIGKYKMIFRNEAQAPGAKKEDPNSAPVPDTLNTYVMPGNQIQQQLDRMRQSKAGQQLDKIAPRPQVGATAREYARVMDGPDKPAAATGSSTKYLILLLVLTLVGLLAILAAVVIYFFVLKGNSSAGTPKAFLDMTPYYFLFL